MNPHCKVNSMTCHLQQFCHLEPNYTICIILYCIVLYHIVLYCIILFVHKLMWLIFGKGAILGQIPTCKKGHKLDIKYL